MTIVIVSVATAPCLEVIVPAANSAWPVVSYCWTLLVNQASVNLKYARAVRCDPSRRSRRPIRFELARPPGRKTCLRSPTMQSGAPEEENGGRTLCSDGLCGKQVCDVLKCFRTIEFPTNRTGRSQAAIEMWRPVRQSRRGTTCRQKRWTCACRASRNPRASLPVSI